MNLQDLPEHLHKVATMYSQYLIPIAYRRRSVSEERLYKVLDQVANPERVLVPLRLQIRKHPYSLDEQILLSIFSYQENVLDQVPKDQMTPRVQRLHKLLQDMEGDTVETPAPSKTPKRSFKETLLTTLSSIESASPIHSKKLVRTPLGMVRIDKESSFLQVISHEALETMVEEDQGIAVQEMLKVPTKGGIEELIQSPLVVFFADRYGSNQIFIDTSITYTDTLTTLNGDRFFLGSVIEDVEGQARTFVRCEDQFISTDGAVGPLPPSVSTRGLLYVYQPLYESIDDYHLKYWVTKDTLCIFPFTDTLTDIFRLYKDIFLTVHVAKCYPTLQRFFKPEPKGEPKAEAGDEGPPLTLRILNLSDFIGITRPVSLKR